MADLQDAGVPALAGKLVDALADILKTSTSAEALQAQQLLLTRLAIAGDVFPSRVPPPKNISEVGGYLNLLETLNEAEIRSQMLAAAVGVAGPNPPPGFLPTGPILFDVLRTNDRPAGAAQASIPVQFRMRNDFAAAFDAALRIIHESGCALPILSMPLALPGAVQASTPPTELLPFLGRTLDLMPNAALIDPDADALAVARLDGTTNLEVVARQLDGTAPNAASVTTKKWVAWKCDTTSCVESTADRKYLQLTPILNAAGWYQQPLAPPVKLAQPGTWARWTNLTGLITSVTKFRDELTQRFTREQIAVSSLRDALDWTWDGQTFKQ